MLVDTQEPLDTAQNAIQSKKGLGPDTDMHIDEEGRPRFAPAKNTVSGRALEVLERD